ncbi:MAG: undecaprenyldiphospho-muramoylpentapeptide beta-N-acetylglucosaminyltransferase [Tannerella sp.]|jgi:UDP-N-acetylglucosamine--N-acetylmuramyl-(pentapeptide) pyrophosphoryl-undecaprenol N-acetylglucosamine transferase|nr:undecaprenyldiphospho-muramoylpentapeptide beta-N-acetylglucosaminyltransferase [Tannerella sp.]
MSEYKIIISGGGTGGHIFPAIAIADAFVERHPDTQILFVGADNRMEMERVPRAGYKIVGLPVSGFDRRRLHKNFAVIMRFLKSLRIAKRIIRDFAPDIVVGTGGYASAPTLWAASSLKIPTLIQEQNSYAGITNKLLARRASTICVAYEDMEKYFPENKIVFTGNPVRKELESCRIDRMSAISHFGLKPYLKTVLVIGGSLGARSINDGIRNRLKQLAEAKVQVIWQTGKNYYANIKRELEQSEAKEFIYCADFIAEMEYAYAAADLVVSRAGAGSISELCLQGKPSILVPSPNVAEDHQTKNANAVAEHNAAIMLADKYADIHLTDSILKHIHNNSLLEMLRNNIHSMGVSKSAKLIVNEMEKLTDKTVDVWMQKQ